NAFSGVVDMAASGNIAFEGDVVAASNMTLNGADIGFVGDNQFSGPATFTATSGSVTFNGDNSFSDTVEIGSANDITFTDDLIISSMMSLNAGNDINLSGSNNQLSGELTLSGESININNTAATTLASVAAQNLTINSSGDITSSGAVVVQDGSMGGVTSLTSTEGSIILENENNNLEQVSLTAANDVTLVESDGILLADVSAGGALNVTANNGLIANDAAIGDMGVGTLTATTINLNASEGAIVDQSSLLTAESVTLAAASGIGEGSVTHDDNGFLVESTGAINTNTSTLSVINVSFDEGGSIATESTSGAVNINNSGDVIIDDLRNYGDIILENSGNITLTVTENVGAINAHYGGEITDASYAGSVALLNGGTNSLSTTGIGYNEADILAENLIVNSVARFGDQARPTRLRVNNQFTLFASQGAVFYFGGRPNSVTTSADLALLVIQGFSGLSSQQLINIETLSEIDPAIFTEVRNYNHDDVAILLPADQRYGYDSGDEEEENENKDG
ncbi:hypothetical protein MNBD_GAMMA18-2472, partial [hydrothermal vent metagenome]